MSVRTITSVTWLWIASLLIATVGVSGQQIYCYCMGKTTFSMFAEDDSCADHPGAPAKKCCARHDVMPSRGCCEKKDSAEEKSGCTKKTTKVFQLKTEFTVQEKWTETLPAFTADVDFDIVHFAPFQLIPHHRNTGFQTFANPPPPLSGRMICVRHGVFRC